MATLFMKKYKPKKLGNKFNFIWANCFNHYWCYCIAIEARGSIILRAIKGRFKGL